MLASRFAVALLFGAGVVWAADPFIGSWKLNVSKSDFGKGPRARSGTASYAAEGNGYLYNSETIFTEDVIARLRGPILFERTVSEGNLDGRAVTFVSKKLDDNSYETIFTDKETGKVAQTFRYNVSPEDSTLTFTWLNSGGEAPVMKLVYDRQ